MALDCGRRDITQSNCVQGASNRPTDMLLLRLLLLLLLLMLLSLPLWLLRWLVLQLFGLLRQCWLLGPIGK